MTFGRQAGADVSWAALIVLSMLAVHAAAAPVPDQPSWRTSTRHHVTKAIWLFPLYLFAINIFVLPIAFAGLMQFPDGAVDADTFVLTLPMVDKRELALALLVFIGGLSAATGMVIVETIALSTMICNDLVMPLLLRLEGAARCRPAPISPGCSSRIRRGAIVVADHARLRCTSRVAGEAYALVSIGLISFAAVAQFAPAILGGMYWKGGTRARRDPGLAAGFTVWGYTLLLPSFAKSGWLPLTFIDQGPFGIALLKPQQLFGPATTRPDYPFAVLEHARQSRRIHRPLAVRPAECG